MLRNSYMNKYERKILSEGEAKKLRHDEEYLLRLSRPLSEEKIANLPKKKLTTFVEDVMANNTIGKVLYSSNAKREIDRQEKSNKYVQHNLYVSPSRKNKAEPVSIVKNKMRNEIYSQIINEVKDFKIKTQRDSIQQKKLVNENYRKIKQELFNEKKNFYEPIKKNRINNYYRAFDSVRNKFIISDRKFYSPTPTSEESKGNNGINNRMKSLMYSKNLFSMFDNKVQMPEVKLNIHDVFSRLYHNAVLLSENNENNENNENKEKENTDNDEENFKKIGHSKNNSSIPTAFSSTIGNKGLATKRRKKIFLRPNDMTSIKRKGSEASYKNSKSFHVSNALSCANGKEFTVRIDDDMKSKCFYKYSGGPGVLDNMKYYINKEREKMKSQKNKGEKSLCNVDFYKLRDVNGNTFLHIVAQENLCEMADYFINKGVDINAQNHNGDTALHIAVRRRNLKLIEIFKKAGARVDIQNYRKETAYKLSTPETKNI